jgi:hypothetical protein
MLTPTPSPPGECVPPAFGAGGGHTRWVERGWGVNILEDARHCSVLYICKYFVGSIYQWAVLQLVQQIFFIQHCFPCRPSDSVLEDALIEPATVHNY